MYVSMDPSLPLYLSLSHTPSSSFLSYVHKECFGSSELRQENRFEIRIMCVGMKLEKQELVIRNDSGGIFRFTAPYHTLQQEDEPYTTHWST